MYRSWRVLLLAAVSCGLIAQVLAKTPDVVASLRQAITTKVANREFMGAVLVARHGRILLSQGYGFANLEWHIPNTPHTRFRIASVSKQFTAAAILLLEEHGKLKTADPIGKYLTDAPPAWSKVTIFHLLTHTSGIANFTDFPNYAHFELLPATPQDLVAQFRDKPLEFEPGERWSYSNSGYVLLGCLIEKLGGRPYADFIKQNIFDPLGMQDSGYESNTAIVPQRASGYSPGSAGPVNAGYLDMSVPFAAGGLYSTTEDLLRWEQALFNGRLLSRASLEKMTTPFKNNYAFGLVVGGDPERKTIEHGGGIEGFNSALIYYPQDEVVVIVLANLNGHIGELAKDLGAIAQGWHPPSSPEQPK
jgi:CubicO group peptidase (beta-lactamase class C family)